MPQHVQNASEAAMPSPTPAKPIPANVPSIQPGSGFCYRCELAWGKLRRFWLRTFRKNYVQKMAALRNGETTGAPHEILDPRDLKFCFNQCTARWPHEADPFTWRDKLPFARWGLCELFMMGVPLLALTLFMVWLGGPWRYGAVVPAVLLGLVVYFFRDPHRVIPTAENCVVSPADGKVVEITELDYNEFIGGPAVRIGIFLSIFNVHINRAPMPSRVVELQYKPGEFLNAMNPESAIRNEAMWIGLETTSKPYRKMIVRQISGLIARRIVCALAPDQRLERGEQIGMIKLGSRTELILPNVPDLEIKTAVGDVVKAGTTLFALFESETTENSPKGTTA